jgi:flagella basal body P-ring formation protein FlgA
MSIDITNTTNLTPPIQEESESSEESERSQSNSHKVYSQDALTIINKFKDKYMAATSASSRLTIARAQILPELFNYWKAKGKIYKGHRLKMKSNVSAILNFKNFIDDYLGIY